MTATSGPASDRRRHLVAAAAGLVLVVLCGAVAHGGKVGSVERRVFRVFNDAPAWLYRILWVFQQFGNLIIALLLGLAVALLLRNRRLAVCVVAGVVLKLGVEKLIKQVVERQRPGSVIPHPHLRGDVAASGLSFVSGHAVITAAMAGLVSPVLPRQWRLVPWVLVVLNGIARIYVGAHNPLDVIGGVGAGVLIAGVLNALVLPEQEPARPAGAATRSAR